MAENSFDNCDVCKKEADYLDVVGRTSSFLSVTPVWVARSLALSWKSGG